MKLSHRCVGIGVWFIVASATAGAQPLTVQPFLPGSPWPAATAESTVTRTYPGGEHAPSRLVESRTRAHDVEIVTSILEQPDIEGRLRPSVETTTETTRVGPDAVHTRRDVFTFEQSGRKVLVEMAQVDEETRADGTIDIVRSSWSPGVSGQLTLTSRETERTRTVSPGARETDTTIYRPGINRPLIESERIHRMERHVGPGLRRSETTVFAVDANGRFQPTETRSQEIHTVGSTDDWEDETIQRLDLNGRLSVDERNVVRRSVVDGRERVTVETFSVEGRGGSANLQLHRRTRRTTTIAADGSGRTDEEVEERVPIAAGEPLRLMARSVSTIRSVDGRYLEMRRELLERDVNHVMVPSLAETGTATASGSTPP